MSLIRYFAGAGILIPTYLGVKVGQLPLINFQRLALLMIAAGVVYRFASGRGSARQIENFLRRESYVLTPALMYFVWRIVTALVSDSLGYSLFLATLEIVTQYFLLVAVCVYVNSYSRFFSLVRVLLSTFLLVMVIGFIESIVEQNLFKSIIPESALTQGYVQSALTEKVRDVYRVQAAFLHPLVLAEYIVVFFPVLIFAHKVKIFGRFTNLYSLCAVPLAFYVLWRTGSRSGMMCLAAELAALVTIRFFHDVGKVRSGSAVIRVFVFVLVGVIALPFAYERFDSVVFGTTESEAMSTMARLSQLESGVDALSSSPVFGYGVGNSVNYASSENDKTQELSVDNYYLTVVVESGVPGLLLFVFMLFRFLRRSRRVDRNWKISLYSLAVSYSIVGLLSFNVILSIYELYPFVFLLLGLMLSVRRLINRDPMFKVNEHMQMAGLLGEPAQIRRLR